MRIKLGVIVAIVALAVATPVLAGDTNPHELHVAILYNGAPYVADVIYCIEANDPFHLDTVYTTVWGCSECAEVTCLWDADSASFQGARLDFYAPVALGGVTFTPNGVWFADNISQIRQVRLAYYPTNEYNATYHDWEGTHYITYTVTSPTPTPSPTPTATATPTATLTPTPSPTPTAGIDVTPIATLTPLAYPGEPTSVGLTEGFGAGFAETYGALSGHGIIPDVAVDAQTWLFTTRKWIAFLNQGNLLYVLAGFLMAGMVLNWALDRVKNPR
jgi:hypothetical protein